ncbi:aldo/keto reductase [Nonomuraea roseoviolacea subsp. roseoviolacea]|uniref:Aryl-alcohol dehydrogenase-like predicted oxidoreductase n=1 Tax=Nonomuraea roseoviolacea subsp. carminata TaxID=160689 RepID=A0ABT1K527_9ACTN|nr:aldo/keto reductase [Nonomuraea roseoviolacea]MCP2349110.1 aryl-alcohol dehydrogenase-like predicted oxidoreductase [Nonomuraea roseoviolacea subsp. carminata]
MNTRPLGQTTVSSIGLGAMPMSVAEHMPDEAQSIRTIHAALDAGVTLIDTADAYAPAHDQVGHNERLVAKALASWGGDRDAVLVATKGGHTRVPDGGWALDGRPSYLVEACERSLRALGVEAIGLYQHHRPDPSVPYEETIGALRDLLDAGKIRMAGISNADPGQIRTAYDILGGRLASVQNQYSPAFRSSEPEVDVCEDLGVAFLPWSPLGGISSAGRLGGEYEAFAKVAEGRGVSPQRVCLAWELSRSPVVIPIPGASRPESVLDSVAAADLVLTAEELALLDG